MKKLRNLDQLSPEKRAALEAMLSSPEEVVTPMQAQPILEADPNTLEAELEEGVFTQTIGELLEQARTSRGGGYVNWPDACR